MMILQSPANFVEQYYRDRLKFLVPAISFACHYNGEFNAWVSTKGTREPRWSIEICDGLIHSSHLVCMAAMSSPNCLPSIGNPDAETGWVKQLSKPLPWLDAISSYQQIQDELGSIRIRPTCPERAQFSDRLLTNMLDFALYHELGHISHRHLGALQNLSERYSSKPGSDSQRIARHVKEMQADATATIVSAMRCNNADDYEHRLRGWGLGACLLTYLLGASGDIDTLTGSSHPHPSVRLIHVGSVATSYPGLGVREEDWRGFISDMADVVTDLQIYSSAVRFLTTHREEAHAEYIRVLAHFEDASTPGLNPPQELLDVMQGKIKTN